MTNSFVWGIINNVVIVCCCGGTGRRKGLKIPRWKHRVGSIPISSTTSSRTSYHSRRLFFYICGKVTSHSLLSLTLRKRCGEKSCRTFPAFQNKSRLLILSLVNALATAKRRYQLVLVQICKLRKFLY